ncbi:phosphoribosylglycinamide formyltransferase [Cytophagales bacterium LB-30]|uniref:Phosphoribosylglycinamide formyltransferase n=1 Tax=Shiella aurantiaca TaxID=3058365 RepID=A0ABT8F2D3_9BACT|nr:phosphoribosylglycinamide formyltransferase [Shiella aurantiaca]MDN4164610.1 phosphoribosylglycinamide formyltransferase [Shiella aurantiaca]
MKKFRIAIFASGSGTNAEAIMQHFTQHEQIEVGLIASNKADAYVLQRAQNHQVPAITFTRPEFYQTEIILSVLMQYEIDFIVLAGFMWLVPDYLVKNFPNKIVNIHPALLPKYGGKGMYGIHVHEAVIQAKEKESGISIHWVNEHYDEGAIIHQAKCTIEANDTPESLAQKIHHLEHRDYPVVIEKIVLQSMR